MPITDLRRVHPHHGWGNVAPDLSAGVAPIHPAENNQTDIKPRLDRGAHRPWRLVQPDPRAGLQAEHLAEAQAWAGRLPAMRTGAPAASSGTEAA